MAENEITVKVEREIKFFKKIDTLEGGTQVFAFQGAPHLVLISPEPRIILIPGLCFQIFNPISLPDLEMVKEGDLIQLTASPDHEVYKAWNPSEEYAIEPGFTRTMRVRFAMKDNEQFPIIGADEAL